MALVNVRTDSYTLTPSQMDNLASEFYGKRFSTRAVKTLRYSFIPVRDEHPKIEGTADERAAAFMAVLRGGFKKSDAPELPEQPDTP